MPSSQAVDQELERWFYDNTAGVLWPLEGFVLFAARLSEVFVRRCRDVMEDWVGGAYDFAAPEHQDSNPLPKSLDPPGPIMRRWLIKWLEDISYDLLMHDGCTSIDYDYAISLILRPVREALYAMALDRGKTHNELMPRKLPPEVFCGILEHVSFQDIISATKVCSLWRQRVLAAPRLWRTLELSTPPAKAATGARRPRELMALSKGLPLSLVVRNIRPRHLARDLQRPLACNLARMRRLELHFDEEDGGCLRSLSEVLHGSPAPLLEKFVLRLPERSKPVFCLSRAIFRGVAPRLTDVELPSCIPQEPWLWPNAKTFDSVCTLTTHYARSADRDSDATAADMRAVQFCHLLAAFRHVTSLTLAAVNTGSQLPLLYADTSVLSLRLVVPESAPTDALLALLDPAPGARAPGHARDHIHVRALTLAFAGALPGAALLAATRALPPWTHVAAAPLTCGDSDAPMMRLSVWCGAERVRHFEFARAEQDVLSSLRKNALFTDAHVDADWECERSLGGCKEEVFGVDFIRALRNRFAGLPVGIRPCCE